MLKHWRKWLLEGLIVLAIVAGVQLWQLRGLATGPAPELAGKMLDGRPASLAGTLAAAEGRPVLVAFWATWCPVCKAEEHNLANIADDTPLLTVAMQSGEAAEVARHMAERGRRYATIADPDGKLAAAWHVGGVPAHFIVDGSGRIRFRVVGYATEWGLRARLWWAGQFPG